VAQSAAERKIAYRLRHDTPFYSRHVLKVVNEHGQLVPFVYRRAQMKLDAALEEQRKAGRPMRAIVLKSRKVGISTSVQAKIFHETVQEENCRSLIVAQDTDTAGELFEISDRFYSHLPEDPTNPDFKPPLTSRRNSPGGMKQLVWGEPSRAKRDKGEVGVNSSLKIGTAKEVQAGRGKTIRKLHLSEVAFWDDLMGAVGGASSPGKKKMLSLLNAVPDVPGSLIVIESTANGSNFFKARWDRAERGQGSYAAVFIGWTEDENCWREFDDPDHRARFIEEIGTGEYGEDEPWLIRKFGCVPEQLLWRRVTIVDKCDGSLTAFRQEYPSTPMEAFVGSGNQFFPFKLVAQAEDDARSWDPPAEIPDVEPTKQPGDGLLVPSGFRQRVLAMGTQEVPTGALWLPAGPAQLESEKPLWRVWRHPVKAGDEVDGEVVREPRPYIVFADVAAGEEQTSSGESDYHAIQVVDHLTREQVAQYRSRVDRDELALEVLLAGLYFNEALVGVEVTGGLGLTVVEILWKRMQYRKLYRRRAQGTSRERPQPLLGWDTNRNTKPAMEDEATALLREGSHGIRSLDLVAEMKTYVRYPNGQRGADDDAFDDLLMAWMGAQRIAQLIPPKITRPERRKHYNSMMRPTGRAF
jgi:hypothetical protein